MLSKCAISICRCIYFFFPHILLKWEPIPLLWWILLHNGAMTFSSAINISAHIKSITYIFICMYARRARTHHTYIRNFNFHLTECNNDIFDVFMRCTLHIAHCSAQSNESACHFRWLDEWNFNFNALALARWHRHPCHNYIIRAVIRYIAFEIFAWNCVLNAIFGLHRKRQLEI